jgi:predicted TIM-barrel fold metal-dependent hydrolase
MIIDCHCHAGLGDKMTSPWNTHAPLKSYLRRARAAQIDRTIVMAPFHSDYAVANAQLARIVVRHPGRLIGFAFVHCTRDAGRILQIVDDAVRKWDFRGIKVHGHEAMPTREVCHAARTFRIPLLVDVTSRAEIVDMIAPQYPDVNFIVAHLGSNTDDFRAHQQVAYQLARYPNVFADTSAVRQFDYILRRSNARGRANFSLAPMGRGFIPGSRSRKFACWDYL